LTRVFKDEEAFSAPQKARLDGKAGKKSVLSSNAPFGCVPREGPLFSESSSSSFS
jgi:hypothetical protein